MGKLAMYLVIISGVLLLFHFAGLVERTPNSYLLNATMNYQNIQQEDIYKLETGSNKGIGLKGYLAGAIAAAIIIGFFVANTELALNSLFMLYIVSLLFDIFAVTAKVNSVNSILATLIFGPLILLLMLTIVEWINKRD